MEIVKKLKEEKYFIGKIFDYEDKRLCIIGRDKEKFSEENFKAFLEFHDFKNKYSINHDDYVSFITVFKT